MGVAGPPPTDKEAYKAKEEKMTCSICKGRGYIITDIISGNSEPCHCKETPPLEGKVIAYGDGISLSPAIGMNVRILLNRHHHNCLSRHIYNCGEIVTIKNIFITASPVLLSRGITHVLNVIDDHKTKQTIHFPTECEIIV